MSGGAGGSFRGVRNTSKTCEVRNWAKSFGNLDLDSLRRIGLRIRHALLPGFRPGAADLNAPRIPPDPVIFICCILRAKVEWKTESTRDQKVQRTV